LGVGERRCRRVLDRGNHRDLLHREAKESAMTDILERLLAALDEDERIALGAKSYTGRWSWSHGFGEMCNDPDCAFGTLLDVAEPGENVEGVVLMQVHGYDITEPWQGADHIARQDPDSTLARIAGIRKVAQMHGPMPAGGLGIIQCEHCAGLCHSRSGLMCETGGDAPFPCETLLALAEAYGIMDGGQA
jgi:uncharacterized protein DUF6221